MPAWKYLVSAGKRASAFLLVPGACWEACLCLLDNGQCLLRSVLVPAWKCLVPSGKRAGACLEVPSAFWEACLCLLGSV